MVHCGLFFPSVNFLIHVLVIIINKVCNKDICDFKSQLLYIMSDKIRVWLNITIEKV